MNERTRESELPDLLRRRTEKPPLWLRAACFAGAGVAFVAGVIGWLLPVVTGIPFYVVGLALLGIASDRVRDWINRMERRFPSRVRWKLRRTLAKIPSRRLRSVVNMPEAPVDGASQNST